MPPPAPRRRAPAHRAAAVAVAALSALVAVVALAGPAASAPDPKAPRALADGEWLGTQSYSIEGTDAGGGNANGGGKGPLQITVVNGSVSGTFAIGGSSVLFEADSKVAMDFAIAGRFLGSSEALLGRATELAIQGVAEVHGFQVPFDVTIPEDELGTSEYVIVTASCSFASGTWGIETVDALDQAGAQVDEFKGHWTARRFATISPGQSFEDVDALLAQGEVLLLHMRTDGKVDGGALVTWLNQADSLNAKAKEAGKVATPCGGATKAHWATPASAIVRDMLVEVTIHPFDFPDGTYLDLVAAGYQTGVLPDPELDATLETRIKIRMDEALTAKDRGRLELLTASAQAYGWVDAAATGVNNLGRLGS